MVRALLAVGKLLALGLVVLAVVTVVRTPAPPAATTTGPPTTTPAPATTSTISPTTTTAPTTTTTAQLSPDQAWPTPESTGPRTALSQLTASGSITTSHDGQLIERLDVTGKITILHNNVTIRDSRLRYTTNYGIHVQRQNGECPTGTTIEYVELDGSLVPDNYAPAYDESCGFSWDHVYMHNAGTAIRSYQNGTFTNNYLVNDRGRSQAHREPIVIRGANNLIRNNVLICNVPSGGCSAALALYSSPDAVRNTIVENNFFAATAAYCLYGGANKDFGDQASNIIIRNNAFSISLTPDTPDECGRAGNITTFADGVRGNERYGNYIYETGEPID